MTPCPHQDATVDETGLCISCRADRMEDMKARIWADPDVRAAAIKFDTLMDSAMRFAREGRQ